MTESRAALTESQLAQPQPDGQLGVTRPVGPRWLKLKADYMVVRDARRFATYVLREAKVSDDDHIDDITLIVSELVTNALRAAAKLGPWPHYARPVHVGVAVRPRWTHIYVVDPDPALPAPAPMPSEDALLNDSGRGLPIVRDLAGMPTWWVQGRYGKTLHVIIPRADVKLTDWERKALRRRAIV